MTIIDKKGITSGYVAHADWFAAGNPNLRRLSAMGIYAFSLDTEGSAGLTLIVRGGPILTAGVWTFVTDTTLTLTNNITNYVERNAAGVALTNTVGFTSTNFPIAKVPTTGGVIDWVNTEDWRQEKGDPGFSDPSQPSPPSVWDDEFNGSSLNAQWTVDTTTSGAVPLVKRFDGAHGLYLAPPLAAAWTGWQVASAPVYRKIGQVAPLLATHDYRVSARIGLARASTPYVGVGVYLGSSTTGKQLIITYGNFGAFGTSGLIYFSLLDNDDATLTQPAGCGQATVNQFRELTIGFGYANYSGTHYWLPYFSLDDSEAYYDLGTVDAVAILGAEPDRIGVITNNLNHTRVRNFRVNNTTYLPRT